MGQERLTLLGYLVAIPDFAACCLTYKKNDFKTTVSESEGIFEYQDDPNTKKDKSKGINVIQN
jgi:hypothetical protein